MTATIDYAGGRFLVSVFRDGRRIEYRHGGYRDVITFATDMGVPRREITLTPAAQSAAMGVAR